VEKSLGNRSKGNEESDCMWPWLNPYHHKERKKGMKAWGRGTGKNREVSGWERNSYTPSNLLRCRFVFINLFSLSKKLRLSMA
jgi:hypothetical protein